MIRRALMVGIGATIVLVTGGCDPDGEPPPPEQAQQEQETSANSSPPTPGPIVDVTDTGGPATHRVNEAPTNNVTQTYELDPDYFKRAAMVALVDHSTPTAYYFSPGAEITVAFIDGSSYKIKRPASDGDLEWTCYDADDTSHKLSAGSDGELPACMNKEIDTITAQRGMSTLSGDMIIIQYLN